MKETFGQRLARLRKEKGLTQEEVANRIVISPQAVSKWENGNSEPDLNTLNQLADIFDVSVDELLGRENKEIKEDKEQAKEEEAVQETADEVVKVKTNKKVSKVSIIISSILGGLCLIGYIIMGILWTDQHMGWKVGWVLLLLPIIIGSLLNAIKDHRSTHFIYPLLVVAVYCTLGFLGQYYGFPGWNFYWFLFLTIPAFYIIFGPIDEYVLKPRYPEEDDDDDDDDDDDEDDGKKKTIRIEIDSK